MSLPKNEELVVDGLLKFRAGKHTDDIGIREAHSPFHVPWTWTEMALTYAKNGQFNIYVRGAVFPSHSWYFNGQRVKLILQKPVEMNQNEIAFTTGAPATIPQPNDTYQPGAVFTHRYTLPAGPQFSLSQEEN